MYFYFGGAQWYLDNVGLAVGELVYCIGGIILMCILMFIASWHYGDKGAAHVWLIFFLWLFGGIVWWFTEIIIIASGNATDGNGVPLSS